MNGNFAPLESFRPRTAPSAGTVLGSGRRRIDGEDVASIVAQLKSAHIDNLVLVGGNGTMALLNKIEVAARSDGFDVAVIGIPKSIDNDLAHTDFSPGYASAARFLNRTIRDISLDHKAMASVDPIRVVETMGRNVGWLAAAGALSVKDAALQCDLVLLPEYPLTRDEIASIAEEAFSRRGRAFIVCSEGIDFGESSDDYQEENHQQLLAGGVARRLAEFLGGELGQPARGEVLGTQQRSATSLTSTADMLAARVVGNAAAKLIPLNRSGVMVGLKRSSSHPLRLEPYEVSLSQVAGETRKLPTDYLPTSPANVQRLCGWLAPLTADQSPR